jgi:hypothetical protein
MIVDKRQSSINIWFKSVFAVERVGGAAMLGPAPRVWPVVPADGFEGGDLDDFERAMVEMLLAWAPYGDPPEEDCLPLFGKTVADLKAEVRELVRWRRRCSARDRFLLMRVAQVLGSVAPGPSASPRNQP